MSREADTPKRTPLVVVSRLIDKSDHGMNANDIAVLFVLVGREDSRTESIFVSVAGIASRAGMSERTVRRVLPRLHELGYVLEDEKRNGRATVYRLNLDAIRKRVEDHPRTPVRESAVRESAVRESAHPGHVGHAPRSESPRTPATLADDHGSCLHANPHAVGEEPLTPNGSDAVAVESEVAPRERPFHVRRMEEAFVVKAFQAGVTDVTGSAYVVPRKELSALDDAVDAHCPAGLDSSGRDAWLKAKASEYRRAISGRENFHKSGGPTGFLEWLNIGAPDAAWLAMSPDERRAKREVKNIAKQVDASIRERRKVERTEETEAVATRDVRQAAATALLHFTPSRTAVRA